MKILFNLQLDYFVFDEEEEVELYTNDYPLPRVNDKVIAYPKGYCYSYNGSQEKKFNVENIVYNYPENTVTVYLGEPE